MGVAKPHDREAFNRPSAWFHGFMACNLTAKFVKRLIKPTAVPFSSSYQS